MGLTEKVLLALYRASSRLILGSGDNAGWIYEKVQRPRNAFAIALNMAGFYLGLPRIPTVVTVMLEPVYGCNLRCKLCFAWGESAPRREDLRPRLMSWDLFRKAVDEAPPSVESFTFCSAGEPLLHPRLDEMINYCAGKGLRTVIYTNGTLLKGEALHKLADSRLSILKLSIEADAEASREMRGVDNDVIRRNLEEFVTVKRPETLVKLSAIVHADNVDQLDEARRKWGPLVTSLDLNPLMGYEGSGEPQLCMEPWRGNVSVYTDGRITPCCLDVMADLYIGNLNEQNFTDILRSETFHDLIKRFMNGQAPKRCAECSELTKPGLPRKAPKRKLRRSG